MEGVWQDVNYGLRGFRKQAGFAVLATVALALGIGAATAIFSVIDNVLLDPWPYRDAGRIVSVQIHDLQRSAPGGRGAYPTSEFQEYVRQTHVFEDVVGVGNSDVLYTTREGTERLQGAEVTANAFRFLGMQPLAGRGIEPEDGKPGAPLVFAMSYKMWVKYFSRDPNLIGRSFILNDQPRTLVGIMPPRFTYFGADLWLPRDPDPAAADAQHRFFFFQARLKPRVHSRSGGKRLRCGRAAHGQALSGQLPRALQYSCRDLDRHGRRPFSQDVDGTVGSGRAVAVHRLR